MEFGLSPAQAAGLAAGAEHEFGNIDCMVGSTSLGSGTLIVHNSALAWAPTKDGSGWQVPYPSIVLHAVSNDASLAGGSTCLMCHLDEAAEPEGGEPSPTVLLVPAPSSAASATAMFDAVSACASLHPEEVPDGEGGSVADRGEDRMFTAADFTTPAPSTEAAAQGGGGSLSTLPTTEGMTLLHTEEECDASALAAWEAKFIPPEAALPGVVPGQFQD